MKRHAALGLLLLAITAGCAQADHERTDRIDIDGVDCVVTRNAAGRITRTDCNWTDVEPSPALGRIAAAVSFAVEHVQAGM